MFKKLNEWIKDKIRCWLGINEDLRYISDGMSHQQRQMNKDQSELVKLKKELNLFKSATDIAVDVHERTDSWAVGCIAGKKEYVKFVRLEQRDARDVMMFLNHSCEPNVGILGQIVFVAMRDIDRDEELTIDYAMFGADKEPMQCNCSASDCRGLITDSDWKITKLQKKYKGYFSSYIQLKINDI